MKKTDIKEYTDKQLRDHLADEKLSLTKMKLAHSVSPLESPMKIRQTKKFIAMLKTEQRARQIKKAAGQVK